MAFPFPPNPVNGQQVQYTNQKGRLMVATYNSVKNEWEVETALPPSNIITSTPEFNVLPTADGQSVVWDAGQGKWIAKLLTYKTQNLTDVHSTADPTADQVLRWNDGTKQYEPADLPGGDVLQATSDQVGAQAGATDADKVAALYTLLEPTKTAKEGDVLLVSEGTNATLRSSVGSWFYTGTVWVLGASRGGPATPTPTINYRGSTTDPQEAGVVTGDLDVVTETNNKQINVYDGAAYQPVLGELQIKQWIAAGSLFQGTIENLVDLGTTLPAPDVTNKGFYWTWTGPAGTAVTPADFNNGGGFTATLQVGDWIQSDSTKYVHVPSDLMSKLRWEGVGSFQTWADQAYENNTLVIRQGRYYRATTAVVPGDIPPGDPGSNWADITPTFDLGELGDVDTTLVTDPGELYLYYDRLSSTWQPRVINLDTLDDVEAATNSQGGTLTDGDILHYDSANTQWVSDPISTVTKQSVSIGDLSDLALTPLVDGHFLVYDGATSTWKNTPTVRASVDFVSDIGDVEINQAPEVGQGIAWSGSKWVPQTFGGMDEWRVGNTYAQNALVLHANSIWLATAEIDPGNEPGGTDADSGLWKQELNISVELLADVDHTTPPADKQILVFDAASQTWKYQNVQTTIAAADDTTITTPQEGQQLVYRTDKWVNETPAAVGGGTVGDIKTSILTEPQFKAQMGADGGGWVLADGRDVTGSSYSTITGNNTVPDLRGAYFRMAGQSSRDTGWNGGTLGQFQGDLTRRPNSAFTGSTNTTGSHTHTTSLKKCASSSGNIASGNIAFGDNYNYSINNWTNSAGNHSHSVSITGGGDAETRPKSYSVNYYIKVN